MNLQTRERPINLQADEARAARRGDLTMLWRLVKDQCCNDEYTLDAPTGIITRHTSTGFDQDDVGFMIGDRLWARETWVDLLAVSPASDQPYEARPGDRVIEPPTFYYDSNNRIRWHYDGCIISYLADGDVEFCDGDGFSGDMANKADLPRWKSPVCMPRKYSRFDLTVSDLYLKRFRDITEAEAKAAGAEQVDTGKIKLSYLFGLWFLLGYERSFKWESNPWLLGLTLGKVKGHS